MISGQLKVILCLGAPFLPPNCACWIKTSTTGIIPPHTHQKVCMVKSTANFKIMHSFQSVKKFLPLVRIKTKFYQLVKICEAVKIQRAENLLRVYISEIFYFAELTAQANTIL